MSAHSVGPWSQMLRPEERREHVRAQLTESARILTVLQERRDLSAAEFEMEMRMQILWLTNAANQWHTATCEMAEIARVRELFLKWEGPGQ